MNLTTIEYEKREHLAYVTLNRPDKLNAMNADMHRELGEVWDDLQDPEMRVAILSGNGRCFSAGADLSGGFQYRYNGDFPDITRANRVYKPIVSALHSHVVGYGMWIALDADIRIAAPDTSFWLPEPQWGIATIPAAWFPRLMPWAIASELLLLAERIDAKRAHEVGLINKIVPAENLMAEAEKAAQRLAALSPAAVQGMKELMVRGGNLDYTALDQITEIVQNRVMNSDDRKEGGRAFVEKRAAVWSSTDMDYVVVGAGSAGCAVACRLVEGGANVALLEAGPKDRDIRIHVPRRQLLYRDKVNWNFGPVQHRRASGSPAARQSAGRILFDQRHALCARQRSRFRRMGTDGVPWLVLSGCLAVFPKVIRRAATRIPRRG